MGNRFFQEFVLGLCLLICLSGCGGGSHGTNPGDTTVKGILIDQNSAPVSAIIIDAQGASVTETDIAGAFQLLAQSIAGEIELLVETAAFTDSVEFAVTPQNSGFVSVVLEADFSTKEVHVIQVTQGNQETSLDSSDPLGKEADSAATPEFGGNIRKRKWKWEQEHKDKNTVEQGSPSTDPGSADGEDSIIDSITTESSDLGSGCVDQRDCAGGSLSSSNSGFPPSSDDCLSSGDGGGTSDGDTDDQRSTGRRR